MRLRQSAAGVSGYSRKTAAVSGGPLKGLASSLVVWRRAAAPFALLANYRVALLAVLAGVAGFLLAWTTRPHALWLAASAVFLMIAVFVLGYATHAHRQRLWAPLTHLQRRQYAEVWNSLADSQQIPRVALADVPDDEPLGPSTSQCLQNLLELAEVRGTDRVLEIGCGTGRIGMKLAAHCLEWTGADISARMLSLAASRLSALKNVRFTQLEGGYLDAFQAS